MIRRFNYTGRIKIPRSNVDITLHKDKDGKYFRAKIDFANLELPGDAKIYIEANYKGVYQRFSFGSVSHFTEPESTRLNELPDTELVYFDVSVVDESGNIGLLLAKARGIVVSSVGTPNDRIPLLPVNPADLKNQFWKLSFDSADDGRPTLEINKNIPDVFEKARNDLNFICLVYPSAFRGVLNKIMEEDAFEEEEGNWAADWRKFIVNVLGIKNLPAADSETKGLNPEQEAWIDDCVNEYCKQLQLFEKFITQ